MRTQTYLRAGAAALALLASSSAMQAEVTVLGCADWNRGAL
jgi:hypothetical protein